jgi:hypothetical protein
VDWAWRTKKKPPPKAHASDELGQQTRDNFIVVPFGFINLLEAELFFKF